MGNYVPSDPHRTRSITDTLLEAEEEHWLDCPTADFLIRAAASLLDGILCFLIYSAWGRLEQVAGAYLAGSPLSHSLSLGNAAAVAAYSISILRIASLYLYFFWATATFGGTPGKLLLGLRVVDGATGQKLSAPRLFLRAVGYTISALAVGSGFLMPLWRKDRLALHDLLSRSVVKRVHGDL